MTRICQRVQGQLPAYADGTLPAWRRALLRRHLRRCPECQDALEDERAVQDRLAGLAASTERPKEPVPEGLLDALLAQADDRGLRARAAVPARGAVSGARPVLSVAALLAAAVLGTAVGYAVWRAMRATQASLSRRRGQR